MAVPSKRMLLALVICWVIVVIILSAGERNNGFILSSSPSSSVCDIYDYQTPIEEDYPCVMMNMTPSTWICLYPTASDCFISRAFKTGKVFDAFNVWLVKEWLRSDEELGLIDLGANIGTFTLAAAAMGRHVVAVEPNLESAKRLHKAIKLGELEKQITLVRNAVSKDRGTTRMMVSQKNQGRTVIGQNETYDSTVETILMDDLLPLITFKKAIMKIDIEGYEHFAFTKAEKLFRGIDIRYIIMEWDCVKEKGDPTATVEDRTAFDKMMDILHDHGYAATVCRKDTTTPLEKPWQEWPYNVCWRKQQH